MLKLIQIEKEYPAGDAKVAALRGINIEFRKNEFVSVLGPSGCGKTTLLNLIGGLDQYTAGDLVINGKSTKKFTDADWDAYRNHSVGFVFQSYNLIPHQTVLANVELALTISGVSKSERRRRAKEALEKVGLANEIHKRPNQMSGGQMQRVAIARALVNDPEILLADEPTGALDSETSVQIMELLKEVARDRLVIMVTHNPELAEAYSTRIVRILDGKLTGDTDPYTEPEQPAPEAPVKKKKEKRLKNRSMSFFTALSLSLNNLRTKKGRTFLTSFAGSIGIIGIALILSVSSGVQAYIDRVQEDTLSGYPITLQSESVDMSSLITTIMDANTEAEASSHDLDAVYANRVLYDLIRAVSNTSNIKHNNLSAFKHYLETTPAFDEYLNAVRYTYDLNLHIYTEGKDGTIIRSDPASVMADVMGAAGAAGGASAMSGGGSSMSAFASYQIWQELLPGKDGVLINPLLEEQYDVIGRLPESAHEIVLIVDERNEVSDLALLALGLRTADEVREELAASARGEALTAQQSWSFDEIFAMTFKLIPTSEFYQKNKDGTYTDLSQSDTGLSYLYHSDAAIDLRVVGILRPASDTVSASSTGGIGYTTALTSEVIARALEKDIVIDQLADPTTDVVTGLPFPGEDVELSDEDKIARVKQHFASLSDEEKAAVYLGLRSRMDEAQLETATEQTLASYSREQLNAMLVKLYAEQMGITDTAQVEAYIAGMSDEDISAAAKEPVKASIAAQYAKKIAAELSALPLRDLAARFDAETFSDADYLYAFDTYLPASVSDSTFERNLRAFGYVDEDSPSSILLYSSTFADKDEIAALITDYNASASEKDQISYTDYVKLLMSSITTIISAISYVLIAFVAISLVVSSIMIGIITYISVLERTKEIGILRAIGASKKNVAELFNAETVIIGFTSGALGVGITYLLCIPINMLLHHLTGLGNLSAHLPIPTAVILVLISVLLTLFSGIIPSRSAAKKDPVVALRTE